MHRLMKATYIVWSIGYLFVAMMIASSQGCVAKNNEPLQDLSAATDGAISDNDALQSINPADGRLNDGLQSNLPDSKSNQPKADQQLAADQSTHPKKDAGQTNTSDASIINGTDGPCTPNCTNRQCGPDPSCGTMCGICNTGLICSNAGQCAASTCKPNSPQVADTQAEADYQETSIALDAKGAAHIIYKKKHPTKPYTYVLQYATNKSGSWKDEIVGSIEDPEYQNSIQVDANGHVHILCHTHNGSDLMYATNATGSWVVTPLQDFANASAGHDNALGIDSKGKLHVIYTVFNSYGVSYIPDTTLHYMTNASGAWVQKELYKTSNVGETVSLVVDKNDKLHISYFDKTGGIMRYATNLSGTWQHQNVADSIPANSFTYSSLRLDKQGHVHMSYRVSSYDKAALHYATNANGTGWTTQLVDTANTAGGYSTILVDNQNHIHIVYHRWLFDPYANPYLDSHDLIHATNSLGYWTKDVLDGASRGGQRCDATMDSNGKVHASYFDDTYDNILYVTACPK